MISNKEKRWITPLNPVHISGLITIHKIIDFLYTMVKENYKHTWQQTSLIRLSIVQFLQNHLMTSTHFCNWDGSQSSSSSSSSSNNSWLWYRSWKVSSFSTLTLFCKSYKQHCQSQSRFYKMVRNYGCGCKPKGFQYLNKQTKL